MQISITVHRDFPKRPFEVTTGCNGAVPFVTINKGNTLIRMIELNLNPRRGRLGFSMITEDDIPF